VSTRYYEFAPGDKDNVIRFDKEIDRNWNDYRAGGDAVLDWVQQQQEGATHGVGESLIAPGMYFPGGQEALFFLLGAGTASRADGI